MSQGHAAGRLCKLVKGTGKAEFNDQHTVVHLAQHRVEVLLSKYESELGLSMSRDSERKTQRLTSRCMRAK